ncbi:MAG TPA: histidine kinase [Sphaerochaeta sp.]|nr:histidine kinase [Sphaerochaeta sp.]
MRFETKIFFTYSILILLLVSSLTLGVRHYVIEQTKEKAIQTMEATSEKNIRQLEELIRPMEFITDFLLSDMQVLSSMSLMAVMDSSTKQSLEYKETAKIAIRHALYTYCIMENFYRVSYFNDRQDFLTSNFQVKTKREGEFDYTSIPWIENARALRGKAVVGGAYPDPWSALDKEPAMVFGLGRAMPGIGYVEVQQEIFHLEEIFALESFPNLKAIAFDSNDTLLYSDFPSEEREHYLNVAKPLSHDFAQFTIVEDETDKIIIGSYSESTGIRVLLVQDMDSIISSVSWMNGITLLVALLILLVSFAYIFILARKLTKPLRNLKMQIENTNLDTLTKGIEVDTSNDEIEAASKAYARLLVQLDEAIIHQKNMALLNLQAQLNSLQAQINPHFLNNVLNVISYRGIQNNDEMVCNMCDSLASLLQYSTDTKTHYATLEEEVSNFSHYEFLLKVRYGDKLLFKSSMEASTKTQEVPRFLIQPIVENSIKHGFENHQGIMMISVTVNEEKGWWYVSIKDNGQGFPPHRLKALNLEMAQVADKLFRLHENIEFTSKGIGIINTYARMLLFYGSEENIHFSVRNRKERGAEIRFGAKMGQAKGREA